ncbi:MAG: hypothetical protein EBV03_11810, partial [Proteobacteria bacterium]|nr:hypothetical protein [Pseudomonadota bacterium]
IPSWLWRHQAEAGVTDGEEYSVWHVIHRVVGAAAYNGLQHKIFADEATARNFYDEVALMLAQRVVALPVAKLASLGLSWAYGVTDNGNVSAMHRAAISGLAIAADNAALEKMGSAQGELGQKLQAMLKRAGLRQQVQIQFTDTAREWQNHTSGSADPLRIMLNLLSFQRDGGIDCAALRHTVRLMTLLAALHEQPHVSFGIANLSSLLLMLGQPYDSKAGRSTAAAVTAIIGASATQTSAELAAIIGPHSDYTAQRAAHLRILRNRQRAAWGEATDYDHLSILPTGLQLDAGSDLALIAAAREGWDRAVDSVQHSGLHLFPHVDCFTLPECAALFGTTDQGLVPLPALLVTQQSEPEKFMTQLLSAARHALLHLSISEQLAQKIQQHIVGTGSLNQAPVINTTSLQQHGFTKDALQKIEAYLPHVTSLRYAMTPMIVGEQFCLERLKLTPKQIANPAFNLLAHLGFSDQQIDRADQFIFGHGQVNDCADLTAAQRQLFATGEAVATTAQIAMQSAVQPFA